MNAVSPSYQSWFPGTTCRYGASGSLWESAARYGPTSRFSYSSTCAAGVALVAAHDQQSAPPGQVRRAVRRRDLELGPGEQRGHGVGGGEAVTEVGDVVEPQVAVGAAEVEVALGLDLAHQLALVVVLTEDAADDDLQARLQQQARLQPAGGPLLRERLGRVLGHLRGRREVAPRVRRRRQGCGPSAGASCAAPGVLGGWAPRRGGDGVEAPVAWRTESRGGPTGSSPPSRHDGVTAWSPGRAGRSAALTRR
jgi:hypothetical protein